VLLLSEMDPIYSDADAVPGMFIAMEEAGNGPLTILVKPAAIAAELQIIL